jgi:hypothetical protein
MIDPGQLIGLWLFGVCAAVAVLLVAIAWFFW